MRHRADSLTREAESLPEWTGPEAGGTSRRKTFTHRGERPVGRSQPISIGCWVQVVPQHKPPPPHPAPPHHVPCWVFHIARSGASGDWKAKLSQRPLNLSWETVSIPKEAGFNASFTLTCSLRPRWGLEICTFSCLPGRLQSQRSGGTCGHRAGQSRAQVPSPRAACSPPAVCQALFRVT